MTTSAISLIALTPEMIREYGLTPEEFQKIRQLLGGREPTRTELGIFSVMWSEHCSYKSSRVHLKRLPTRSKLVVQGPGENAGIVDIGDGWACAFKIEAQRIHYCYGPCTHGENIAQNPAYAGGCSLKGFDE